MNFLAHLYLSGDNREIMVGNFIGDFVKGRNQSNHFKADVVKGIELHRAIDEYTDNHAVVLKSKTRLRPKYRHYAPVIVDIFYDHFLANLWNNYHEEPLPVYAQRTYAIIKSFENILPEEVKQLLPFIIRGNWLVNYGQLEGIQRALTGMAKRSRFDSKMDESVNDLRKHYDDFKKEFEEFFPELKEFSSAFIADH